jgi:hypothetical protein
MMQNQDTRNTQSAPKDKPFFKIPDRDVFPTLMGKYQGRISVQISAFIVDWQMTETERITESSQVQ